MSNDTDVEVIQKTQKILGKYIKKPQLTDKLLRKPPFRFLHDVVNGVIRETGFLKGLYSERELVSENVKDKDDKIAFLNKLIDATKAITGTELAVRSTKVIAGLEPTETNLLLQAIGTALDKHLDSSQYITQLKLEKKSKSQTNQHASDKKIKSDKSKEKIGIKQEKTKTISTPTTKKNALKTSDKNSSRDSKESARNEVLKPTSKAKKLKEKTTPRESTVRNVQDKNVKQKINKKEDNSKQLLNTVNITNEKEELKIVEQNNRPNTLTKEKKDEFSVNENGLLLQEDLSNDIKENVTSNDNNKDENISLIQKTPLNDYFNYDEETVQAPTAKEVTSDRIKSARPRSGILKTDSDKTNEITSVTEVIPNRLKSAKPRADSLTANGDVLKPVASLQVQNNIEKSLVRPRSSLRPPSVRPSSARPGAPRLRNEITLPEGEVIPLGKVNVIVENYNNKEVDEEETVTIQTAPEPEFQPPILQLPTDKGHLVEQILEQIHQDDIVEHTKTTVNIEWEQDGFRSRNAANKETEQLKSAIQTLTRTANPLGKLVNYLHEDIEAMHSELDMWINSARQIMVDVASQKRITDEFNKPLQAQLAEIQDNIIKHQQQIVSVHGNILRNEQRIRDLLIK